MNVNDVKNINETQIDPHNVGPDTWMEGNIGILSEKEAKKAEVEYRDGAELGVVATKMTLPGGKVVKIVEVNGGSSYKYETNTVNVIGAGVCVFFQSNTNPVTKPVTSGRKAPAEKASSYSIGTKKKGIDGTMWSVVKIKGGILRWSRVK